MQAQELRNILKGNLFARRKELGLTQSQAAKVAGISQAYWAQLEAGDRTPQFDLLADLATALRTSPDTLVSSDAFCPAVVVPEKEFGKNVSAPVDTL